MADTQYKRREIIRDHIIFVGGPIQHAIRRQGSFHAPTRLKIETVIAGLRNGGYKVRSAHEYEDFGRMDVNGKSREVCSRDFRWMRQCDLFVAVLPVDEGGAVIHSAGTMVELGWASTMEKPIVLVCDPSQLYSHLVTGLGAVAPVAKIDINLPDLVSDVCGAVAGLLRTDKLRNHCDATAGEISGPFV
jgi:hypothetical protein